VFSKGNVAAILKSVRVVVGLCIVLFAAFVMCCNTTSAMFTFASHVEVHALHVQEVPDEEVEEEDDNDDDDEEEEEEDNIGRTITAAQAKAILYRVQY
jgi:hypothetical protein